MSGLGPGFQGLGFRYSALLGIPDGNRERFRDHTRTCGWNGKENRNYCVICGVGCSGLR